MISLTRLTPPEGRKRMQRYTLFGNHQNFSAIIFKNKATFSRLLTNIKRNPYKRCHFWTKSLGTTSSKCWYAQSINDEIAGIRDLPVSVSEYSTFGGTCGKTSRRRFFTSNHNKNNPSKTFFYYVTRWFLPENEYLCQQKLQSNKRALYEA